MNKPFMIKASEEILAKKEENRHLKIPMIRALREVTGQGLIEAKNNVETLLRGGVVIIDSVDLCFGDRKRTLYTAREDVKTFPEFFALDENYHTTNTNDF